MPVLPTGGLKFPFDIDFRALGYKLSDVFSEPLPGDDVVPFSALLAGTGAIAEGVAGRERELGHGLARRQVTDLWIAAEVADQNYLIHRHRLPPLA